MRRKFGILSIATWLGAACTPAAGNSARVPSPSCRLQCGTAADTVPVNGQPVTDTDVTLFPNPVDRTQVRMAAVIKLIGDYVTAHGTLPKTLEDVLPTEPKSQWEIDFENDAWHHRFRYRLLGSDYDLRSAGRDGDFDTSDDITVSRSNGTRWGSAR